MQKDKVEPYQALANAIILQAVTDYRNALLGYGCACKKAESVKLECENFFRSEYFSYLTKVSGKYLIEKLRKEAHDASNSNSTDT